MKAILFLAVLLIAAQSNPLHEFYRGFISSLPMESELKNSIMNNGLECLNGGQDVLIGLSHTIKEDLFIGKNYLQVIKGLLHSEEVLKHKIVPQCLYTYQRIIRFFQENRDKAESQDSSLDSLNGMVLRNAVAYETLGKVIVELLNRRGFDAGAKFATLIMINERIISPEVPHIREYNYDYTPKNYEKFLEEFVSGFLSELGANKEQVTAGVSCAKDFVNANNNARSNPALYSNDRLAKTVAYLEGFVMVTESLQRCEEQFDFSPVEKLIKLFMKNPLLILQLPLNHLIGNVVFAQSLLNHEAHLSHGEFALAGQDYAQIVKVHLNNIIF